jgi:hypothetical protein
VRSTKFTSKHLSVYIFLLCTLKKIGYPQKGINLQSIYDSYTFVGSYNAHKLQSHGPWCGKWNIQAEASNQEPKKPGSFPWLQMAGALYCCPWWQLILMPLKKLLEEKTFVWDGKKVIRHGAGSILWPCTAAPRGSDPETSIPTTPSFPEPQD